MYFKLLHSPIGTIGFIGGIYDFEKDIASLIGIKILLE